MSEVTRILSAIESGDVRAVDRLFPIVYQELRKLAAQRLNHEKPGQTLQATALVHEAYLRLVGANQHWDGTGHFFAAAAEAMRRILVENARRKQSLRRGGDRKRVKLEDAELAVDVAPEQLIALDEAISKLAEEDLAVADFVKLRYFVGLTVEQAGELLGISPRTAYRYWAYARARMHQELGKEE